MTHPSWYCPYPDIPGILPWNKSIFPLPSIYPLQDGFYTVILALQTVTPMPDLPAYRYLHVVWDVFDI